MFCFFCCGKNPSIYSSDSILRKFYLCRSILFRQTLLSKKLAVSILVSLSKTSATTNLLIKSTLFLAWVFLGTLFLRKVRYQATKIFFLFVFNSSSKLYSLIRLCSPFKDSSAIFKIIFYSLCHHYYHQDSSFNKMLIGWIWLPVTQPLFCKNIITTLYNTLEMFQI